MRNTLELREDLNGLTKPFAHRLSAMIEARLITSNEWMPWADDVISRMQTPPIWILNLAVTRYWGDAERYVREFAHAEPLEPLSMNDRVDDYVVSLYLCYERRGLSWATFLREAGEEADANGGKHECEYFYEYLTDYEDHEFDPTLEAQQRAAVSADYHELIGSVRRTYETLRRYRRKDPRS